jgi:hypothetical protein
MTVKASYRQGKLCLGPPAKGRLLEKSGAKTGVEAARLKGFVTRQISAA